MDPISGSLGAMTAAALNGPIFRGDASDTERELRARWESRYDDNLAAARRRFAQLTDHAAFISALLVAKNLINDPNQLSEWAAAERARLN